MRGRRREEASFALETAEDATTMLKVDTIRALALLARWASRQAQRVAKERAAAPSDLATFGITNGYGRRRRQK